MTTYHDYQQHFYKMLDFFPPASAINLKSFKFSHYISYYFIHNNNFYTFYTFDFFKTLSEPYHLHPFTKFPNFLKLEQHITSQFPK